MLKSHTSQTDTIDSARCGVRSGSTLFVIRSFYAKYGKIVIFVSETPKYKWTRPNNKDEEVKQQVFQTTANA